MNRKRLSLLLVFLILLLTACSNGEKTNTKVEVETEQRKNVIETDAETGEKYYLMADFENYYECTQVKYAASFGTITQINKKDQPDMVTYGDQSIKVEILGTETTWMQRKPSIRFSTDCGFFDLTRDFSNMTKFTFDIYNAQDYEANIRFFVNTSTEKQVTYEDEYQTNLNYEWNILNDIDLEPNSWNHIEIDAEDIRILRHGANGPYFVYGAEALEVVGGFYLHFDRGELHEEPEVFYIDNVRAYISEETNNLEE